MMDIQQQIELIIQENVSTGVIGVGVSPKDIEYIELKLELKLPESYKWFLSKYGNLMILGIEIYGVTKEGCYQCVESTLDRRIIGLPNNLVVIQNCDEWVYCLDTTTIQEIDCKIISWNRHEGCIEETFKGFYEYLNETLIVAKENWDD